MDKMLKVAVMLTAVDKMSRVVRDAVGASESALKGLQEKSRQAFGAGTATAGAGAAILAGMAPAVQAFADLEDSSTRLKTAMMGPGGVVSGEFAKVNELAIQLGNRLPGTTADFQNMFEVMLNNGVQAQTILGGVGEAAAYLSVALKMPYEEAAKFASKLRESTGVADRDMMQFLDTIARVKNLGVEAGEMQYAFGRSGGALKLLGVQGLEASKSISAVYAQLIRAGMSGETVGTGFSAIVNSMLDPKKMKAMNEEAAKLGVSLQFFKDGKFLGVENLIAQLDKLRGFTADKRAGIVNALTGGGQDASMLQTLISNGVEGFNKMNQQMANQATLGAKVEEQLKTLKSIWEATTGTITNLLAALGAGLGPTLKSVANLIGTVAAAMQEFFAANPALAEFLGLAIGGIGVFLSVVGVVKLLQGAFLALRVVMMANPFMLVATVAIVAISFIYSNWGKISAWFKALWDKVKAVFLGFWEWAKNLFLNYTALGLVIKHWEVITTFFGNLWDKVKAIFQGWVDYIMGLGNRFLEAGENIVNSIWEGIKRTAHKPIEAIQNMTKKIREYLPFSPAKVGPLKDIHRIRLVETIADSMKPNAMLRAMQQTTQAVFDFRPGGAPSLALARSSGGSVTVEMNINVGAGAGRGAAADFIAELRRHAPEIGRIVQEAMAQRDRRALG